MLEALFIMSLIYACLYMPVRGKTWEQLSLKQQQRVEKEYHKYMRTKKGRNTPDLTVQEYLPIIQKQAMAYVIMAIAIVPIYLLVLLYVYPTLF